ncbi:MAG: hypothetical protein HZA53_17625 [Planctomycetes bacterium]|nr:hypothetical protein [Planctomycetota bacterium]
MSNAAELPFARHAVATLAYRAAKVLRGFPEAHANDRLSPATRTAHEILEHLGDLADWATSLAAGAEKWEPRASPTWKEGEERFFAGLRALDDALVAGPPSETLKKLLQGPIADALTHVGQLALLRGLAGAAVRPESFARADIQAGHVGRDQPAPRKEFDGDASRGRRKG